MLQVLSRPMLKEMSNYLDEEWLGGEQAQYSTYSHQLQHMSPSAEAQQLGYGHSPYQHPKGVPVSYPHSTPGYPYPTETLQQAYEGLDLTNSSLFPSSLHGPVPTSSVSSPSQGGQATRVDDSRSAVFGSPIPQSSHLMISRSPAAARSQPSHLLSSQSPVLQTPRSIHLLASQTALPVHTSNPQQIRTVKRPREESDPWDPSVGQRRRSRSGSVVPRMQSDLSEEEQLLLKLKHEDSLPWKDIAREFETRLNRTYQVPALQMRYKRLRERLRTWSDDDVQALKAAHEYWEKSKFEIISQKMLEFGAAEKWPARLCERKWEELRQPFADLSQPEDPSSYPLLPSTSPHATDPSLTKSATELTRHSQPGRWTYSNTEPTAAIPEHSQVEYAKPDDP